MKSTIQYIGFILLAALLAGCSDDATIATNTLSGNGEKTPIEVAALLDAGGNTQTRAVDKEFETGDELLAYIRHVTADATTSNGVTIYSNVSSVIADDAPRLVKFTKQEKSMKNYSGDDISPLGLSTKTEEADKKLGLTADNTKETDDLVATYKDAQGNDHTGLYWDDFSAGAKGDATDLRTDGHYLQSYYGYCYNGGTPSPALTKETGVLGWEVETDQTQTGNFQHSDLLWSCEQTPIRYDHSTANVGENHGKLVLPYTHAMSKVTINVTLGEGFDQSPSLDNLAVVLQNMYTECTVTAPSYTLSNKNTEANITMKKTASGTSFKFEAIVVPSVLTIGNNLATITDLDGDTYVIPVTQQMIQVATTENGQKGWGGQLTETTENISGGVAQVSPRQGPINQGKGYEMKYGVNYVLNVTISKQTIQVSAMIKDWTTIEAQGRAEVKFTADIVSHDKENAITTDGAKFDLWYSTTTSFGDYSKKATTATFDNDNDGDETEDTWVCDPKVFWPNSSTNYYFRGLAKYEAVSETDATMTYKSATDFNATQGTDLVWATTAAHTGNYIDADGTTKSKDYAAGAAINPRTGTVPMQFEHAMTKVTIQLETATADAAKVDFDGAKIEITNLATGGTINLTDGAITEGSNTEAAYTTTHSTTGSAVTSLKIVDGQCFIPQTIADNAKLTLTLKDGTTYSLQLNKCTVEGTDAEGNTTTTDLTTWSRGTHYTYTIHVEKEVITFRALIKDWVETTGSGNATLDWD